MSNQDQQAGNRPDQRRNNQIRPVRFTNHIAPNALGSTLIEWGNTKVICGACVDPVTPRWMKEQGVEGGWLTAEYSMLPYSTLDRKRRDITRGRIDGRSQEIQRLIGRALRAAVDLKQLGSRTIWLDCDVLQADGGTRTASITGAFVALSLAIQKLLETGKLTRSPIIQAVAGVSVGVVEGQALLDLSYEEDSNAEVDMNLVMTESGEYVEVQGSAERRSYTAEQLNTMLQLGNQGIADLLTLQRLALGGDQELR